MATCKHKIGFLSLKECDKLASVVCSACNKPVCKHHYREVDGVPFCPDCYVEQVSEDEAEAEGWGSILHRRRTYHHIGYRPYYYGHIHRYNEDDYQDFESREDIDIGDEDQLEPSAFQDS